MQTPTSQPITFRAEEESQQKTHATSTTGGSAKDRKNPLKP
jgi:hypothetical protein